MAYVPVADYASEMHDPAARAAIADFERAIKRAAAARARASTDRRRAAEQAQARAARELAAVLRTPLTQ